MNAQRHILLSFTETEIFQFLHRKKQNIIYFLFLLYIFLDEKSK